VFVLSRDILKSEFCMKELRSAISNNKPIIVIRYYDYEVQPEEWTPELADIKKVVESTPHILWMAEFNNFCVKKLINEYMGESELFLKVVKKWRKYDPKGKLLLETLEKRGTLDLTTWIGDQDDEDAEDEDGDDDDEDGDEEQAPDPKPEEKKGNKSKSEEDIFDTDQDLAINRLLRALRVNLKIPVEKVKKIDMRYLRTDEEDPLRRSLEEDDLLELKNFPNLTELDLSNTAVSGPGEMLLTDVVPKLEVLKWTDSSCSGLFLRYLEHLPHLRDLDVQGSNAEFSFIAGKQAPSVVSLNVSYLEMNDNELDTILTAFPNLKTINISETEGITEADLKKLQQRGLNIINNKDPNKEEEKDDEEKGDEEGEGEDEDEDEE